ncbi:hypothetical protein B0H10DRAFT_2119793 [Mycena sp. CBHHK59/15]|nr:hypothetical protein B0H10DRAFT_2119793 [Mycena sp. CBHHK59/15]
MSWFYCVANFANPQSITIVPWPYPYTALILALVFQMFQSWRIYMFNKSKILVGIILATALAAFGAGSAVALQALTQVHQLAGFTVLQPVIGANNVLQCAVDLSIAIILSTMFSGLKMNGTRRTDKILNRLIRTAIRSGFFTGIFALGILFSFHFLPNTYMVGLFFLPIGRIYTHTMMDHFVGREELCNMFFDGVSAPTFNVVVSVPTFNVVATGGMEAVMMLGNVSSTPSKDPEANGTT